MRHRPRPSHRLIPLVALIAMTFGCAAPGADSEAASGTATAAADGKARYRIAAADTAGLEQAIFAGGCFWCLETAFEGVKGVKSVISGYAGGPERNPTYEQVSNGETAHAEAVLVTFDPKVIPYTRLLEIFWVNHDPTTSDRQFCDRGHQYRPAIYYRGAGQKRLAEASVQWALAHRRFTGKIVTEISPATAFWPAEVYHQDFWKKDPIRYTTYRAGCGRDARLAQLWGRAPAH
jgi:peptide-methionine (S)-S-oxide reductase